MRAGVRVLIVRLSAIGDCLHALPAVASLRQQVPDAHIGWAIQQPAHELLAGHAAVDRFHLYPRRSQGPAGVVRQMLRFRRELRAERYDVAIDLQGLFKSGMAAWLSGAPRRIGFRGPESRELNRIFVNQRVPDEREPDPRAADSRSPEALAQRHVIGRNLTLLGALGLDVPAPAAWSESWKLDAASPSGGLAAFLRTRAAGREIAVVNPGTTWATKKWPVARFAEVAAWLARERGLAVFVSWGTDDERRDAREVAELSQCPSVYPLPPTGLDEIAGVIAQARLFVGNDTGPMHLAVALGTPVVAVFGATDPTRNGPYGAGHLTVVTDQDLDCRPCNKSRCARSDIACLNWLSADPVIVACERLLA